MGEPIAYGVWLVKDASSITLTKKEDTIMEKTYKVNIKIDQSTIYTVKVNANNEEEAMEFAYDMLEHDSYAEID